MLGKADAFARDVRFGVGSLAGGALGITKSLFSFAPGAWGIYSGFGRMCCIWRFPESNYPLEL